MPKLEIIMFNMSSYSEWASGVVNRNYHIFSELLKRPEVERIITVDFLPFTLKRAVKNYLENIIKGPRGEIIYQDLTTKCIKISGYPAELYVFSTIDSLFSQQKVIEKLKKVLEIVSKKDDKIIDRRIVWSYFPIFVDYFDKIPADLFVFDAVDNWLYHPSFLKYKKILEKNYQIIAQKSDLIFTVAEKLKDFFISLGRKENVHFIPNGVDLAHFQGEFSTPEEIKRIPRPIIGYVGTIQNRVDIDLLCHLAKKNPDKSLVLVGPIWPQFLKKFRKPALPIRKLKKFKNVYLLGRKQYSVSPAYIQSFDVAIIPHKLDEFIKYTYSLKLLEYLACAKPIVSTPPSGVEKFSHLVYIAKDYREFNEKIQKALTEKGEFKEDRIAAGREHSWEKIVDKMIDSVSKNK